jgi:YidC/Oxa1 family membrane protein insertase
MDKENSRNTIVFVVCAVAMLILYQTFVMVPAQKRQAAEAQARAAAAAQAGLTVLPDGRVAPNPVSQFVSREQASVASPRAPIDSPALTGSVALKGGRIDDLYLKQYRVALSPTSPPVELFRPEGARQAHFAEFGWTGATGAPTQQSLWTLVSGGTLAPNRPLVLSFNNGQGLVFTRTIAVDDLYMFTVTDQVTNRSGQPVRLAPYASVQRQGQPELSKTPIIHEGGVGELGDRLELVPFKNWKKTGRVEKPSTGGWLGLTDKYWLAAVIPDQRQAIQGDFRVTTVNGVDVYEANYVSGAVDLAPNQQATAVHRLFAGAKKVSILKNYETSLGIKRFDDAVDWGMFWFFTRPIFQLLSFFQGHIGNFGLAILLLTVVVKAVFFPLANKSYESISKMKKLQPQMEAIKKRNEKDPAKAQQETMALYQSEKINPLMGCLPILIQIPVFFSLYKVLFVTIEMRHAPFYGWIHDLSAPDPTSFLNLFGLIPWNPAMTPMIGAFLDGPMHIGVWPLLYGFSMWLTQSMSPAPSQDPTQKMIFQFFPIIFTFMLGRMPAGLVIYWCWSNTLSILQQYVIMRRYKVENPIDDLIARVSGKRRVPAKT